MGRTCPFTGSGLVIAAFVMLACFFLGFVCDICFIIIAAVIFAVHLAPVASIGFQVHKGPTAGSRAQEGTEVGVQESRFQQGLGFRVY